MIKRYTFLLGQTELFSHFIDVEKIAKQHPELSEFLKNSSQSKEQKKE
jgi:F0F1-type ATP synthase delta subunit